MASSTIGTAQDYTTISLWESNEQRDLVTATEIEEGQCLDELFSESVNVSGWTTSSSYYPKLTAQAGTSFNGIAGNGPRMNDGSNVLTATNIDFYVSLMELYGGGFCMYFNVGGAAPGPKVGWIERCILHDSGTNALVLSGQSGKEISVQFWNCICYDLGSNAIEAVDADATLYAENVAIYDPTFRGFRGNSSTTICYNCIVHRGGAGSPNACYAGCGGDYNADGLESGSDNTAPGANSIHDKRLADIDWVSTTGGSEDLHRQATSDLVGAGTDRSGGTIGHTDDIDGDARSAWDIGPDEGVAVGGPSPRAGIFGPIAGPLRGPV